VVKAGALYYALFISFFVTLLVGTLVLMQIMHVQSVRIQEVKNQLEANLRSGLELALYDTSLVPLNQEEIKYDLFGTTDSLDQIQIRQFQWGVYRVMVVRNHWKKYQQSIKAIIGSEINRTDSTVVFMADRERFLSISGNTRIVGRAYLPRLGIRQAFADGMTYSGEKLVYGSVLNSTDNLPEPDQRIISDNSKYLDLSFSDSDSVIDKSNLSFGDTLRNSFNNHTLILFSQNPIILINNNISGNIRIVSASSIVVSGSTKLGNIVLYAPSIFFEKGFSGSIQAFARDTIIARESCRFLYPSSLSLLGQNNSGYCSIGKKSEFAGCIFLYQESETSIPSFLELCDSTSFQGQIYCSGYVEPRGEIKGVVYCHGFSYNTGSAYYENYLINGHINRLTLSPYLAGAYLFGGYEHNKLVQWVN
jgi:hypothetical protein